MTGRCWKIFMILLMPIYASTASATSLSENEEIPAEIRDLSSDIADSFCTEDKPIFERLLDRLREFSIEFSAPKVGKFAFTTKFDGEKSEKAQPIIEISPSDPNCRDRLAWAIANTINITQNKPPSSDTADIEKIYGKVFRTLNIGGKCRREGKFSKPVVILKDPLVVLGIRGTTLGNIQTADWIVSSPSGIKTFSIKSGASVAIFQHPSQSIALETVAVDECSADFRLIIE